MTREASRVLTRVGIRLKPSTLMDELSMGQQQLVEIAKALAKKTRIMVFDEPTTSLSTAEKKHLFSIIRELSAAGISIIYISHNLDDVLDLCGEVAVIRDGNVMCQSPISEMTKSRMISLMVGRKLDQLFPFVEKRLGETVVEAKEIRQGRTLRDISFSLRRGEIAGLFGLMGAGRSELARAIYGLDPIEAGEMSFKGLPVKRPSPEWWIANGMAYITENRREEGLLLSKTVKENLVLASLRHLAELFGAVDTKAEEREATSAIEQLSIKTFDKSRQTVQTLSGGNQQKVVIGKWLLTEPEVLIADEPTRGVDVGAKQEIYNHINEMARNGCAVLFISSEMEELIGVCDRIMVMCDGAVTGEVSRDAFSQDAILALAIRGATEESVTRRRKEAVYTNFYKYGLYFIFVMLALGFTALNGNFASGANAVNLLQQTASTGIAAAGLVFVMVAGGIDISLGSTIFLSSVIVGALANTGIGVLPAFAAAIACGIAVGSLNGFVVSVLNIPPLIVTLASLYIVRGVGLSLTGVQSIFFFNPVGDAVAYTRLWDIIPVAILILALTLFVAQTVLSRTLFGRQLFAIGHNRRAAQIMGIKVKRKLFLTYVISGALAGLAGLISGAQVGAVTPSFAEGQEFIIITSAILGGVSLFGGKGSAFPGAFLGVLIVMCIENGLVMAGANMYAYTIVRGIVIFVAVMIDCMRNTGEIR